MTRTEELLALADAADRSTLANIARWGKQIDPETIKQFVELVRLQHEAIVGIPWRNQTIASKKAIAAFNKFEGRE